MKKLFFLLALSSFLFRPAVHSQVMVGFTTGVSVAKMEGRIKGDGRGGSMFNFVMDANLGKNFSFYPSFGYVQKGVTEPHPQGTLIEKQYVALRYAELSTNFIYHIGGEKGNSFFLGVGPTIDFNLPSKRTSVTAGTKTNTDILFGQTPEKDLRGVDYGSNVVMGYRTKGGFLLSFNYNKGMRDLTPEGLTGETKNSYFGIQLGYYLNTIKK